MLAMCFQSGVHAGHLIVRTVFFGEPGIVKVGVFDIGSFVALDAFIGDKPKRDRHEHHSCGRFHLLGTGAGPNLAFPASVFDFA